MLFATISSRTRRVAEFLIDDNSSLESKKSVLFDDRSALTDVRSIPETWQ